MSNSSQPSRQSNWLSTFVVALAAALGIPTAIIAVSTHFVNDHPWLALLITLAFGVIVFIAYVIVKVWLRLESRWVDVMAEWLDHRVQSLTSRYQHKYCQYLGFQHRDFDVKGLSLQGPYTLELNQVFIELSIDPTTIQLMSANPIPVPQTLREGSHSIWDYLASTPLANQHLAIIGPPGSGKTTLLKHITLTLLAHRKQLRPGTRISYKLPIMLFLRDHVGAIHESASKDIPDFTLVDALHNHLKRWEQPDPPAGWVKRQLERGRCLVMLDGLDEVADPQIRGEVVNWVQMQIVAHGQNRFIITSRPFGFRSNPLSRVAVLEVRPFTTEQVEQFIYKWYLADEIMRKQKDDPGVRMRARAEAKELLQQLYNTPALFDLTVNPLLLTMITIVHRYGGGGKLPEKRIALYTDICRVFLGKRQEARGQELELKPDQLQLVLQPLAYYMMQQGIRDIMPAQAQLVIEEALESISSPMPAEAFLKLVENVSGLLLERESGVYSYAHLTFQEFLTAVYIREKQLGNELVAVVGNIWWQETIRLYCAMADATSIINACLADDHPSMPALLLALDCQKEARELRPEVRTRLETILNQGIEDINPERQHLAAEVMLTRRLHQLVRLKGETYVDTSLVTCAEYQAFLDEQAEQGRYLQPDYWTSPRFLSGQGNKPALGVRSSDAEAFCTWLTERESGPWQYRLPKAGELEEEGISGKLPAGTGYWLKDGKGFVWARGVPTLSSNIFQEIANLPFFHMRASKPTYQNPVDLDNVIERLLQLEDRFLPDSPFHFQPQKRTPTSVGTLSATSTPTPE